MAGADGYGSVDRPETKKKKKPRRNWEWLKAAASVLSLLIVGLLAIGGYKLYLARLGPAVGCSTRLYVIRHAEKDRLDLSNPSLSPEGQRRADALPSFFCDGCAFKRPDFLIARAPSSASRRPLETLLPLSEKYSLPINVGFRHSEGLAAFLLDSTITGKWCGKTAIICWKHSLLPLLASYLGCREDKQCSKWSKHDFNTVWSFDYKLRNGTGGSTEWALSFSSTSFAEQGYISEPN